jgi:hypothetical protein
VEDSEKKKIINDILKASNKIHQQTIRGSGNYIVVGSEVAEQFENINEESVIEEKRKNRDKNIDKLLD